MADRMTPEQRHRCMSHIHSRNTRPEMLVRRYLYAHGFRYRVNVRRLPGTPDIVLSRLRTCIFINGCFWHGHEGCSDFKLPRTNTAFWQQKIDRNRQRDLERQQQLRLMGWNVIRIWGCQLKTKARQEETLQGLLATLSHITLVGYGLREQPEQQLLVAEDEEHYGKR